MQDNDKTSIMFAHDGGCDLPDDSTRFVRQGIHATLMMAGEQIGEPLFFTDGFRAGRGKENDMVIPFGIVSRNHLEVRQELGAWWVYDLGSANGIYLDGVRVAQKSCLRLPAMLRLGDSTCFLRLDATQPQTPASPVREIKPAADQLKTTGHSSTSLTSAVRGNASSTRMDTGVSKETIKARLLAEAELDDAGEYTRMVRALIREDRTQRRKSYRQVIWGVAGLLLLAIGLAIYQQIALSNAKELAIDMFYDIKTLELSLAQAEIRQEEHLDALQSAMHEVKSEKLEAEQAKLTEERQRLAKEREKLQGMRQKYQQYVKEANSLRFRFPTNSAYEEKLIIQVARELGESELEVPPDFINEVRRYVRQWQGSSRLPNAMQNMEKNAYAPIILSALQQQNLPLHFIYLPLQESNYNPQAVGPETRYGIAKGAWQFLATTGQEYGLQPGPLAASREYDPVDQRFDFNKASNAGAKYLKHIYSTEAQASGLLVMAGYNYGHNRVKGLIKKMPENPRERNFWKFIQHYQIPQETYDYVFYIVSAAVIGEDPAHFGFKFKSPLIQP